MFYTLYVDLYMNLVSDCQYSLSPSPCMINSGPSVWSLSVVPQCGASVWCLSVVPQCGPSVWCLSVEPQCGPSVWCLSVEPQCGASVWCMEACGEHNGACCFPSHILDMQGEHCVGTMGSRCHSSAIISCCLNPPMHRSLSQGHLKCDAMSEQLCVLYEGHCTGQNLQSCFSLNRTSGVQ